MISQFRSRQNNNDNNNTHVLTEPGMASAFPASSRCHTHLGVVCGDGPEGAKMGRSIRHFCVGEDFCFFNAKWPQAEIHAFFGFCGTPPRVSKQNIRWRTHDFEILWRLWIIWVNGTSYGDLQSFKSQMPGFLRFTYSLATSQSHGERNPPETIAKESCQVVLFVLEVRLNVLFGGRFQMGSNKTE